MTNPYLNIAYSCCNIVLFKLFIYPFFDSTILQTACGFCYLYLNDEEFLLVHCAMQLVMLIKL